MLATEGNDENGDTEQDTADERKPKAKKQKNKQVSLVKKEVIVNVQQCYLTKLRSFA